MEQTGGTVMAGDHFLKFLNGEVSYQEMQDGMNPIDERLLGYWRHTDSHSFGVSEIYLLLARDGTFARTNRNIFSNTFLDSEGNWAGSSSIDSGLSAQERGRWSVIDGVFRLEYANGHGVEGIYEFSGDSLLCDWIGEERFWKR